MAKKSRRRRSTKAEQERKTRQQKMLVAGVSIVALVIVAVLIAMSVLGGEEEEPVAAPLSTVVDQVEGTETGVTPEGIETGITPEGYPYVGSPDAPVKMMEYSDYFCGHCAAFNAEKVPQIEKEYVATGQVQFIVPYYALGLDARLLVVEASACAADQGMFFPYRHLVFANRQQLAETPPDQWGDLLVQYAQEVGLDTATFETCWEEGQHQDLILASIEEAQSKGVSGTPTFSINGELLVGNLPYETFQQAIEEALTEASP